MNNTKKTIKIIVNVILWVFVAFAVIMTTLAITANNNEGVPSIGGRCFLSVQSDSMSPTFKRGDMIFGKMIKEDEKKNLQEGTVISFYADLNGDGAPEINTHRIVGINTDDKGNVISYKTKGDNWLEDKDAVRVKDVICIYQGGKLPLVGFVITGLQNPTVFLILVVIPMVLLFFYEAFVFIKTITDVKNSGKRLVTAADEELIKQRAIEEYLKQQQLKGEQDDAEISNDAKPE